MVRVAYLCARSSVHRRKWRLLVRWLHLLAPTIATHAHFHMHANISLSLPIYPLTAAASNTSNVIMPTSTRRATKAQAKAQAKKGHDAPRASSTRPGRGKGRRGAKERQPVESPEQHKQEPQRFTAEEKGKQPMPPPETPAQLRAKAAALQAAGKGKLIIKSGGQGVVAAARPTLPTRTSPRTVTSLPPPRPAPILGAAAVAADAQAAITEPKSTRPTKSEMF